MNITQTVIIKFNLCIFFKQQPTTQIQQQPIAPIQQLFQHSSQLECSPANVILTMWY